MSRRAYLRELRVTYPPFSLILVFYLLSNLGLARWSVSHQMFNFQASLSLNDNKKNPIFSFEDESDSWPVWIFWAGSRLFSRKYTTIYFAWSVGRFICRSVTHFPIFRAVFASQPLPNFTCIRPCSTRCNQPTKPCENAHLEGNSKLQLLMKKEQWRYIKLLKENESLAQESARGW